MYALWQQTGIMILTPRVRVQLTPLQRDQTGRIFNIWLLFACVFLNFYLNNQFQNTVCCTYFNIQKQLDATIFDLQFELLCNFATVLATFPKIGQLFSNFWSLCAAATERKKWHKSFIGLGSSRTFLTLSCN
jgi:hypothetical protein